MSADDPYDTIEDVLATIREDLTKKTPRPLDAYEVRVAPHERDRLRKEYVSAADATVLDAAAAPAMAPTAVTIVTGDELGHIAHYRLLRQLGRGGQGTVYFAEDERLHRKVALKVLHDAIVPDSEHFVRFRREAEATSRLDHPGICSVHDVGVDRGQAFIAMRYVDGESLDRRIVRARAVHTTTSTEFAFESVGASAQAGGSPASTISRNAGIQGSAPAHRDEIQAIVRIVASAARTLHAAHEAGIVHRDVKPANIMITTGGEVVLLDFGLAHLDDTDLPTVTQTGVLFGTPAYMSPEQLLAQQVKLDRRSDVWSLGVALYEALTGTRPFAASTRESLYHAIQSKEPTPIRKLNAGISHDLRAVVETAMQKDRDRRYQTAALFADDLDRVLSGSPTHARPVGPVGRLVRWSRREPARAALILLAIVTIPSITALVTIHLKDAPIREQTRLRLLEDAKDELLSSASYEIAEGDPKAALRIYRRVLDMEGGSPQAEAGIVLAQLRLNDSAAAAETLDRYSRSLDGTSAQALLRADVLRASGETRAADELEASTPAPSTVFDHLLLAQRALTVGESTRESGDRGRPAFIRAIHHATMAMMLGATRMSALQIRAHAAAHAGEWAVAVESARALRLRWPHSASANFQVGSALTEVADALQDSVEHDRNDSRSVTTSRSELLDEVISAYRESIRFRGENALAHCNLGIALRDRGLIDEAIAELREAKRLDPNAANALTGLSEALLDKELFEESIVNLRELIRIVPSKAEIHMSLGTALGATGRIDEAIASFREAVRLKPDFADAHYNLGTCLFMNGLVDESIVELREAVRTGPKKAEAWTNLAVALDNRGKFDEAIAVLREAIRVQPNLFQAHYHLGKALKAKGLLDQAIASYREAARIEPKDFDARYHLGGALEEQGLVDEAIASFREATRIAPQDPRGYGNLGSALRRAGRTRQALEAFRRSHELASASQRRDSPTADWVAQAEAALAAEEAEENRLADYLTLGTVPRDADEQARLARAALRVGKAAVADSWFSEAFEKSPALSGDLARGLRYGAACAAAKAAAESSDAVEASVLRSRALRRLEDEIKAWSDQYEDERVTAPAVREALARALVEPSLTPLRGDAIALLPEAERPAWSAVWKHLENVLSQL